MPAGRRLLGGPETEFHFGPRASTITANRIRSTDPFTVQAWSARPAGGRRMSRKATLLAFAVLLIAGAAPARAQSTKLALLIPGLYGPDGLKVRSEAKLADGSDHSAHFNSAFQERFTQFNIALASQLAAIPLPSPASGFTYTFDETLGVYQRTTQSFGPILDRAPGDAGPRQAELRDELPALRVRQPRGRRPRRRARGVHARRRAARRRPVGRRHDGHRNRRDRRPDRLLPDLRPRELARRVGGRALRAGRPRRDIGRRRSSGSAPRIPPSISTAPGSGDYGNSAIYSEAPAARAASATSCCA